MVGVTCNVSGTTISNFAGDFAKGVPDRRATTIFFRCSFDLVTSVVLVGDMGVDIRQHTSQ